MFPQLFSRFHAHFSIRSISIAGGMMFFLSLFSPLVSAAPLAGIEILPVSPAMVASSSSDVFDVVSSGLRTVGLGQKVYLEAKPTGSTVIGGYQWAVTLRPSGSTAALSGTSGELVTFVPDRQGNYQIRLTPLDGSMQPTEAAFETLHVGVWIGAGSIADGSTPTVPQCTTSFCHGSGTANPRIRVADKWLNSGHSQVLQSFMNGEHPGTYQTSCLSCHTLGFDQSPTAVNDGFDDMAATLSYNLNQIPALVADAQATGHHNFGMLPAELQHKSSVQCESCHGAGSQHLPHLSLPGRGIDGANLTAKNCRQCHDAPDRQMKFYEWESSRHALPLSGSPSQSATCVRCHTGEGFVSFRIRQEAVTPVVANPSGITCSVCHDPHFSEFDHQLRIAGDFALDSGHLFENAGAGGLCIRCHNARVSNADNTALTSFRGPHNSPQADIFLGANGSSFGLPFEPNSFHTTGVEQTCVTCHMAEPAETGAALSKVGGHTWAMRDGDHLNVENACGTCHGGLTDYDREAWGDYDGNGVVEGTQTEVRGLFTLLRTGIIANFPGTSVSSSGRISITSDAFATLNQPQKKALYNYNLVWSDGSFGIHNTSYAVQLLQRSYEGVFGRPINEDYPSVTLRGPIDSDTIVPMNTRGALAKIEIIAATPRKVSASLTDPLDAPSTGLNAVGTGQKVFLQARPVATGTAFSGFQWEVSPSNAASALTVPGDGSGIVTFQPVGAGKYSIICTPLVGGTPTTATVQIVYAGRWVGSGLMNDPPVTPRAPQCATGFCHGGNNAAEHMNVAPKWIQSKHAQVLQSFLNNERGIYRTSCLPCHTTGFDEDPLAVNSGFDDVVRDAGMTLAEVVAAAGDPNINFQHMPAIVQEKASIQCENCHGSGANHLIQLGAEGRGIDGANLDPRACLRCHDAPPHHMIGYQWEASKHVHPVASPSGRGECVACHTGEGYVSVRVKGAATGEVVEHPNGISCATCHDPHYSPHERQLRVLQDVQLSSGETIRKDTAGLGVLCVQCHNARVSNANNTALTSFRGGHYGPQADMWLGVNGLDLGLPLEPNSFHSTGMMGMPGVPDSCVYCHMAEPSEHGDAPPKVGGHTWAMRERSQTGNPREDKLNVSNACGACHITLNSYDRRAWGDYDGNGRTQGIQTEVFGLISILRTAMLDNLPGASIASNGRVSFSAADYGRLTPDQRKSVYNLNFVWDDGSLGIHNASYAIQLLQRSYYPVTGRYILDDYPSMSTRGPVQTGAGASGWTSYQ